MLVRLRALLIPRVEADERPYRLQLGRIAIRATAGFLLLWTIGESAAYLLLGPSPDLTIDYDFFSILILAFVLLLANRALRRGHLVVVGYLLAASMFLYTALNAVFSPQHILLMNAVLVIPVLIAGLLAGRGPAYVFAGSAILVDILSWIYAQGHLAPAYATLTIAFVFLFAQGLIILVTAAVVGFFSTQMRDSIAALNNQASQMAELAHTDPLTGLANRRWLMDLLTSEFARARRYRRPLSLLYIDLDGFKAINDRFGHMFGDEVLTGSGRSMRAVLRATDLLARIGGDEFAVLLPETNIDGAQNVTTKLRKSLAAYSQQLGPAVPPLTFCAGVAQLRETDTTIDDILARADEAQYLAKATGKGHTRSEQEIAPPVPIHDP